MINPFDRVLFDVEEMEEANAGRDAAIARAKTAELALELALQTIAELKRASTLRPATASHFDAPTISAGSPVVGTDAIWGYAYRIVLPYQSPSAWSYSAGSVGWDRDEAIEHGKNALGSKIGRIQVVPIREGWDPDFSVIDPEHFFDTAVEVADDNMIVDHDDPDSAFARIDPEDADALGDMLHEVWVQWCEQHRSKIDCFHFAGPVITILAEDEAPGDDDEDDEDPGGFA